MSPLRENKSRSFSFVGFGLQTARVITQVCFAAKVHSTSLLPQDKPLVLSVAIEIGNLNHFNMAIHSLLWFWFISLLFDLDLASVFAALSPSCLLYWLSGHPSGLPLFCCWPAYFCGYSPGLPLPASPFSVRLAGSESLIFSIVSAVGDSAFRLHYGRKVLWAFNAETALFSVFILVFVHCGRQWIILMSSCIQCSLNLFALHCLLIHPCFLQVLLSITFKYCMFCVYV